jgi:antitoxin component YwqK of YwqJK toxin-antitoxin module
MKSNLYINFICFFKLLKEAILKPISKRTITAEGWIINQKVDYWFYYYENGNKKEEGHYEDNKNVNGGFYESNKVNKKSEFKNDQLNGFSLFYKKTT